MLRKVDLEPVGVACAKIRDKQNTVEAWRSGKMSQE